LGTLHSALDIARSGLQAAQIQLDVAAHNVANVNREGYSRQRVTLVNRQPITRSFGQVGRGVEVADIERIRDEFLDKVYRQQRPGLGSAEVRAAYYEQIEALFDEPSDEGLGARLNNFFDTLSDFANNVEEQAVRTSVITEAQNLASTLNQVASEIGTLRKNANEEIKNLVPEINSITERIAALNKNISAAEVGGGTANDLRDERDLLLDQLSGLVKITYRENADGQVDVTVAGDILVTRGEYRELAAVRDPTIDPDEPTFVEVRFVDNGQALTITDGELYGALQARDVDLVEVGDRMDVIAATIIEQMNRIQSTGNGLDNLSGLTESANAVDSTTDPLDSVGLPFAITPGTFDVIVYDGSGTPTTTTITITAATTLDSLAADLAAIPNFSASVTVDNTLELGTTGTYTYSFANDSTNALTALGVNVLFTGNRAGNMGVNRTLVDNPELLSSGYSTDVLETGDNSAALDMANVRSLLVLDSGTASINDYYETTVVRVGVNASSNANRLLVQQSFVDDFQQRREQVSGVSIDEEATNLIMYQRAYEASARIITVVDNMLEALFNSVA